MHWKKITLVGVGLLGGSLGMALRQRGLAERVTGFVRRRASVRECRRLGAVDVGTLDLKAAVQGAELVVLCTPIAQMQPLVEEMLPVLQRGAIVTDVGSVKGIVVRDLERRVSSAGAHFVGSHPMAGSEKTGVAAASADLFINAVCVVTPTPKSNAAAVRKVGGLWKSVGALLITLDARRHDELVSRSSHLPHVLAATLANLVLDPAHPVAQSALCANGFRDTTRIASGSPEMWRDIAVANRKNLSRALARYISDVQRFRRLLKSNDQKGIAKFFETAKERRDKWSQRAASRSPE
ncbi:MAG: prephenate dehydrogenase/arogenate dehydrogenase family protein [Verrucomicrobia bacterium]|nr:MAG: prephenate dehydrogenase/arogenate dehydrogenase family protein [Verrucomicrobiota bacterium]